MWADHTERPQSLGKTENTHRRGAWAFVYACGVVRGWGIFWSTVSQMRSHPCLGERGLCGGVSRPVDISEMPRPTATQAGTPPQWSSITPLFWVIPLSIGCLGIISLLHKKLCKSFHPAWCAQGPLTWVDILIYCRKSVPPPCQSGEHKHGKTQAGLMTL